MAINQVQFQRGLAMAEFMKHYGTPELCHATLVVSRWPNGFVCALCGCSRHSAFLRDGSQYWQCSGLPRADHRHQWYRLPRYQAAADQLVPRHALADPGQEQRVGAGAQASPGRWMINSPALDPSLACSQAHSSLETRAPFRLTPRWTRLFVDTKIVRRMLWRITSK